jgi:phage host-nuclease inhibitor protein Gam
VLPPAVPQLFVPVRGTPPQGSRLVYEPRVLGAAQVRFVDTRTRVDAARDVALLAPIAAGPVAVDWGTGTAADLAPGDLGEAPEGKADYQDPGAAAADPKSYAAWKRDLGAWLFANAKLELWRSPSLGEIARVGEPERHFRIRLQQRAREQRDVEAEALRARYAPKMAALEERLRRVRQAEQREGQQASDQRIQTAISVGAALLDAFVGRKLFKASTLGRASTAARGVGRSLKEAGDVARAGENVAAVEAQIAELAEQLRAETESLQARIDPLAEPLEAVVLRPKKTHVTVQFVALAWTPSWVDARGAAVPAWAPPGA